MGKPLPPSSLHQRAVRTQHLVLICDYLISKYRVPGICLSPCGAFPSKLFAQGVRGLLLLPRPWLPSDVPSSTVKHQGPRKRMPESGSQLCKYYIFACWSIDPLPTVLPLKENALIEKHWQSIISECRLPSFPGLRLQLHHGRFVFEFGYAHLPLPQWSASGRA